MLAGAADLLVWLDLGRPQVMAQVVRRTVRRRRRREVLWNGNVEPPMHAIFSDRDHIVRWAWRTHPATALRVRAVLDPRPDLPVVRLTSHAAASSWLRGPLGASAGKVN